MHGDSFVVGIDLRLVLSENEKSTFSRNAGSGKYTVINPFSSPGSLEFIVIVEAERFDGNESNGNDKSSI